MTWFDTHAHLNHPQFEPDRKEVILRARAQGIEYIICCGWDIESSRKALKLSAQYPFIYAAVGLHPHDADNFSQELIEELFKLAQKDKVVAIGEIGLDFYRNYSAPESQRRAFQAQIELARALELPMVIHLRKAHQEGLSMLKANRYFKGVLHCFSGDLSVAEEALEIGFYIGFDGPLTYSHRTRAVAAQVPLSRVMLETDCPWLTPLGFKGERNEPAFLIEIGSTLARLHNRSEDEIARCTTENAQDCFGLA